MAWIDVTSASETGAELKARLDQSGAKVNVGEESSSHIVSASAQNVLRQNESVVTWEYRGLTKAAATRLRDCAYDSTTSSMRYATASQSAKTRSSSVSASVTTGACLRVSATRKDESDQWIAKFVETTYSASGAGWSSSPPASAATTGITTSVKKSKLVNRLTVSGVTIHTVLQVVTISTKEFYYLTESEATAKCANPTDTMQVVSIPIVYQGQTYTFSYSNGSTVTFDMRFVSEADGWTVTETTETRAVQNNNNAS